MMNMFFRNDDVYGADEKLMRLSGMLAGEGIPVHHAVIPKRLTGESSRELAKLKEGNPRLVEYGQHGYSHENLGNGRVKFEFLGMGYEQQKDCIGKGRAIMESMLGKGFTPVFTPPYHKYDTNTLRVLKDLKFKVLSAPVCKGLRPSEYGLSVVPASISFNIPYCGSFITSLRFTIKQLKAMGKQPFIGIYMHHHMFNESDFNNLSLLIRYLRNEGAEFRMLSEIGVCNEDLRNSQ